MNFGEVFAVSGLRIESGGPRAADGNAKAAENEGEVLLLVMPQLFSAVPGPDSGNRRPDGKAAPFRHRPRSQPRPTNRLKFPPARIAWRAITPAPRATGSSHRTSKAGDPQAGSLARASQRVARSGGAYRLVPGRPRRQHQPATLRHGCGERENAERRAAGD